MTKEVSKEIQFGSLMDFRRFPLDWELTCGKEFTANPPVNGREDAQIVTRQGALRGVTVPFGSTCERTLHYLRQKPADYTGADQLWVWLDTQGVSLQSLKISVRSNGIWYEAAANPGETVCGYGKVRGVWEEITLGDDGNIVLPQDFRGYFRLPVTVFRDMKTGERLPLYAAAGFGLSYLLAPDNLGRALSLADIKFSRG